MKERFIYLITLIMLKMIFSISNLLGVVWLIIISILAVLSPKIYHKLVRPLDHREHKL